jgi:NADPH-dependent 2,4-dienoyl-CoA reductase/sulfur reductase-like enzyme
VKESMNRRDVLKLSALLVDPIAPWPVKAAQSGKRVLVAGAGLAGLSCAWELTKSGHDVLTRNSIVVNMYGSAAHRRET